MIIPLFKRLKILFQPGWSKTDEDAICLTVNPNKLTELVPECPEYKGL